MTGNHFNLGITLALINATRVTRKPEFVKKDLENGKFCINYGITFTTIIIRYICACRFSF